MHTQDPDLLRAKALALLEEAQSIDGLKPHIIIHTHEYGDTGYIAWAAHEVGLNEAMTVLDAPFEEDRDETLTVDKDVELKELCGLMNRVGVKVSQDEAPEGPEI